MDYSSASEGEIVESEGEKKAFTRQSHHQDRNVNQLRRPRSHLSGSGRPPYSDHEWESLDYDDRRSRDDHNRRDVGHRPFGESRGTKRRHPDDHHNRENRRPAREHKVFYQDVGSRDRDDRWNHTSKRSPDQDVQRFLPPTAQPDSVVREEEAEIVEPPVVDEAQLIEERRKRREALRAKHGREAPLIQKALHVATSTLSTLDSLPESQNPSAADSPVTAASPATPKTDATSSPAAISVLDDAELANHRVEPDAADDDLGEPSAADYDPSMDMQEDKFHRDAVAHNSRQEREHHPRPNGSSHDVAKAKDASDDFDMFADDVDLDSPETSKNMNESDGIHAFDAVRGKQLDQSLLDDWDDAEGYYRIILGELLDKRYLIQSNLGKGVFSAVVRALDNKTGHVVAIKIIRRQESMYKAGMKEIQTLTKLAEADPEDKKHMIRLERHFMHKAHLCMVFENLSINLREVLKKFGRDIGINIKAVRAYAQQIFLGLGLMKKCDIIHADLKPDNVLVNENRSQLKIADLGSAYDVQDGEVTDVLVSRFYRAPEIMLGIKGDFALDMWSIGCTLFELYTGRICFTGATNNQMLKAIMECRGKIPNRMLKKSEFWAQHFDGDGTFLSQEYDDVTRKEVVRRVQIVRSVPAKELRARLFAGSTKLSVPEAKELNLFADLLDKCLALDPQRRISPNDALRHGFINRTATVSAAAAPPRAK